LSLPLSPKVTFQDQDDLIGAIRAALTGGAPSLELVTETTAALSQPLELDR
jgi:hypothetical protein